MIENTNDTTNEEPKDPTPGTPEHDLLMINRTREGRGEEPLTELPGQAPAEPDTAAVDAPQVPDKFKNADGTINTDALLKSYTELDKMRGAGTLKNAPTDEPTGPAAEDEQALAEKAGLDYDKLAEKIAETGDLDDDDYKAFEKAGIPPKLVKDIVEFRKVESERTYARAVEMIGGEDQTKDLMTWAATNLSEAEISTYNTMLGGPDWERAVTSLQTLQSSAKRTAKDAKLTQPGAAAGASGDGFGSRDEMKAAMANPAYRERGPKGDAYRADVQRKVKMASWR